MFEDVTIPLLLVTASFSFIIASDSGFISHFTHVPAWAAPVFPCLFTPLTFLPFTKVYPDWNLSHFSPLAIARSFEWPIKGSFPSATLFLFILTSLSLMISLNWSWGNDRGFVTRWKDMCSSNLFSSDVVLQSVYSVFKRRWSNASRIADEKKMTCSCVDAFKFQNLSLSQK